MQVLLMRCFDVVKCSRFNDLFRGKFQKEQLIMKQPTGVIHDIAPPSKFSDMVQLFVNELMVDQL